MQYRFVRIANVIVPLRSVTPEHPLNQTRRSNRFLLVAVLVLVAFSLILLFALFVRQSSARPQVGSEATSPSAATDFLKQLQILQLEQQTGSQAEFRSFIPLLSVAVAFAVGIFGAYRYFRDRDRDYGLRVEQDISVNLNQLLDFTKENGSQNARIAYALDNLLWLINQAEEPARHIQRITAAIMTAIREDVDLENPREARFPALCLEHWPYYVDVLKADGGLQRLLPYRYNEALTKLAKKAPNYFAQVQYDPGQFFIAPENVSKDVEEAEFQHFVALVDGLWQHIGLIEDPEIKNEALTDFRQALSNSRLCDQLQKANKILARESSS